MVSTIGKSLAFKCCHVIVSPESNGKVHQFHLISLFSNVFTWLSHIEMFLTASYASLAVLVIAFRLQHFYNLFEFCEFFVILAILSHEKHLEKLFRKTIWKKMLMLKNKWLMVQKTWCYNLDKHGLNFILKISTRGLGLTLNLVLIWLDTLFVKQHS